MQPEDAVRAGFEFVDGLGVGPPLDFGAVSDRYGDYVIEIFELTHENRPMRPGARVGNEEVVAIRFGLEHAVTGRPWTSIRGDPMAKLRGLANKASPVVTRDPGVDVPFAVNHKTHMSILLIGRSVGGEYYLCDFSPTSTRTLVGKKGTFRLPHKDLLTTESSIRQCVPVT